MRLSNFTILCYLKAAECTLKSYKTAKLLFRTLLNMKLSLNERLFFLRVIFM